MVVALFHVIMLCVFTQELLFVVSRKDNMCLAEQSGKVEGRGGGRRDEIDFQKMYHMPAFTKASYPSNHRKARYYCVSIHAVLDDSEKGIKPDQICRPWPMERDRTIGWQWLLSKCPRISR